MMRDREILDPRITRVAFKRPEGCIREPIRADKVKMILGAQEAEDLEEKRAAAAAAAAEMKKWARGKKVMP